jgi:hypothetical protein
MPRLLMAHSRDWRKTARPAGCLLSGQRPAVPFRRCLSDGGRRAQAIGTDGAVANGLDNPPDRPARAVLAAPGPLALRLR